MRKFFEIQMYRIMIYQWINFKAGKYIVIYDGISYSNWNKTLRESPGNRTEYMEKLPKRQKQSSKGVKIFHVTCCDRFFIKTT
jgi:hypothetical protein